MLLDLVDLKLFKTSKVIVLEMQDGARIVVYFQYITLFKSNRMSPCL